MNEGRLIFPEMKIDKTPFLVHTNMHTIDLSNAKVLIRPEQAEGAEGKNVVIGETRPKNVNDKILAREVVLEKAPDGKELIKNTVKARVPGGQEGLLLPVGLLIRTDRSDRFRQPARPVCPRADRGPSNPSAWKWVLGSGMCQKSRGSLLIKNQLLVSF